MPAAPSWWTTRGPASWPYLPLSWLFQLLSGLRRALWRSGWRRAAPLGVPVIVVGNIAAGGSGKTPVVLWLVDALRQQGWNPAIISRGYGGKAQIPTPVTALSTGEQVGDEPVLLARRSAVPVWVGRDRPAVARALLAVRPQIDILVSDDGLQHYPLARDVEIVVIDEQVLGNGWHLPAGPLREPLRRAREAQLVILHGPCSAALRVSLGAVPTAAMQLQPADFYRLDDPGQRRSADSFKGQMLKAVAGIGRPQRFFDTLQALGLDVQDSRAFPDHYRYHAADLALNGADALLMTEKDAIKCCGLAPTETWVLPVDANIDAVALDYILEHLNGPETA